MKHPVGYDHMAQRVMKCPSCASNKVRVTDSRPVDEGTSVRRRRLCTTCGMQWTTFEIDEDQLPAANRMLTRARIRTRRTPETDS